MLQLRRAAIVGGVNSVVAAALIENRATRLADLTEPLSEFVEHALGLVARSWPAEGSR